MRLTKAQLAQSRAADASLKATTLGLEMAAESLSTPWLLSEFQRLVEARPDATEADMEALGNWAYRMADKIRREG